MIQANNLNHSEETFEKLENGSILHTHRMKRAPQEQGPIVKKSYYLMFPWSYNVKISNSRFPRKMTKQRPAEAQVRHLSANGPFWGWRKLGAVTRLGFEDLNLHAINQ